MKNMYSWIFILTFPVFCILFSCSQNQHEQEKTYIISSLAKTDIEHFQIPEHGEFSQPIYYSQFNFIIDSTGNLYYFYFQPIEVVGDSSIARCLISYLRPGQLIQVPDNSTVDFLKCNVLNANKNIIRISIASEKDTIKSKAFNELYLFLKDSIKNLDYTIRPATKEESFYLFCKKQNDYYKPEGKYWDSIKRTHYFRAPIVISDNE